MGIKTIKEFGNDEDSYYTSTIVSTQFTTSASLFAAQAQFVFRPRPNRFYVFTQLPSRPRHAPICSVMEEAEEGGWERILKTLKILD